MNRYRCTVRLPGRKHVFTVDATDSVVAARRALRGFEARDNVAVHVVRTATNIVRPRIERHSHGKARAA